MDKRDERNTASHQRARRPAFRERRERPQKKEAPLSAREVARRALTDVARSGSYVSAALDRHLNTAHLSADDKRLAASLFFTAVENRLLLEARRHADVKECYPFGQTHHLIAGEGFDAGRFVRETTARGFRRVTLRPGGAGIEDVFIKLMRHA